MLLTKNLYKYSYYLYYSSYTRVELLVQVGVPQFHVHGGKEKRHFRRTSTNHTNRILRQWGFPSCTCTTGSTTCTCRAYSSTTGSTEPLVGSKVLTLSYHNEQEVVTLFTTKMQWNSTYIQFLSLGVVLYQNETFYLRCAKLQCTSTSSTWYST